MTDILLARRIDQKCFFSSRSNLRPRFEHFAVVPRNDHIDHLRGRDSSNFHARKVFCAAGSATLDRQIAARDDEAA
jgi:hypothetical protein